VPCDEIPYSRIFCISIGSLEFSGKKPGFLPSGALRDRLFNSRCDLFWHPLLSQAWDRIYIRAWLPCILFLWIHLHMIRNKEFCQHSTKGAMVTHVADDGMLFKMPTCLDYEIVSSNLACSNFFFFLKPLILCNCRRKLFCSLRTVLVSLYYAKLLRFTRDP